ncbi:cobyrinic acid -diamide synthase [Thraustotheca clavata]|uniref:Cobyrinic acid-diamide synthase n=1 Tax=Thraustotheca clavata TaxID=74557 RepID=A0A1V9ZNJ3_9STRA|nr:cobyrinic acid -diamide synthase [Thraustotheca clavata]
MTSNETKRGLPVSIAIAGMATSAATVFSNPMEVVKTRMQLQGELAAAGAPVVYRNSFHAFYTILKVEGIRGIQRGLVAGMGYQTTMNGVRLGGFETLQKVYGATDPNHYSFFLRNMLAGATSGAIGAALGSPFFLVKARLQAQSNATSINAQYHYKGTFDGLRQIIAKDGISGLYRGINGAIPRVAVGSAAQMSTYASSKHLVLSSGFLEDGIIAHFAASLVTGLAVTTAMNPFDVVSTRLYSQKVVDGKGVLYSGVVDCFRKTFGAEGVRGIMAAMARKGIRVQPFKVGPDFLDPMHHTAACGVASVNLDGYMMGQDQVLASFERACQASNAGIAVVEGCMGLYDGTDGKSEGGSTAEIAKWLIAPVVLVIDAWCIGRSAAAMVHGYASFDKNICLAGVIFNKVGGDAHAEWLREAMASSPLTASIPVLGCLPNNANVHVPERHLGLHMPDEVNSSKRIDTLANLVDNHINLDKLFTTQVPNEPVKLSLGATLGPPLRIGVAKDEAFCFYYADNFRVLESLGCELNYFSPLRDKRIPSDVHALYFGGGYPELYAQVLESNLSMRMSIQEFANDGKLIYAECGGLMYLTSKLYTKEKSYSMAAVIPIDATMTPRMTMGYCSVKPSDALTQFLQMPAATSIRCHQFHFSELTYQGDPAEELDENGHVIKLRGVKETAFQCLMERPGAIVSPEGVFQKNVLATYCHVHFGTNIDFASALVAAARRQIPIASFEPSATEIVTAIWDTPLSNALPSRRRLCGVSEFCDAPGVARLTKSLITATTSEAIEAQIQAFHAKGIRDLHRVDQDLLKTSRPGVVFTQDACDRCSAVDSAVAMALNAAGLPLNITHRVKPLSVQDILDAILSVGQVIGESARANILVNQLQARLDIVQTKVFGLPKARILGLESVYPLVASGQWLPDMRLRAGGIEALANSSPGCRPRRLEWQNDVVISTPEVIVVACCGKNALQTVQDMGRYLINQHGFWDLPAMKLSKPRLYAVDHGILSRPGPRIITGIEVLAALFHPSVSFDIESTEELTILQYNGPTNATCDVFVQSFERLSLTTTVSMPLTVEESLEISWDTIHSSTSPEIAAHGMVANNDKLYLISGELPSSMRSSTVWTWERNNWKQVPCSTVYGEESIPTLRSNHAAATWNNIVLVFGGWDHHGLHPLGDLELLDLKTNCWTHGSTRGVAPSPRGNPTMVVDPIHKQALVFGGWNQKERFNDVHSLDLNTWTWHLVVPTNSPPVARTDHSAVWWQGKMIIFGGSSKEAPLNDVWSFDQKTSEWKMLKCSGNPPSPRTSHAAAIMGCKMVITGGQTHLDGTRVFASAYTLDLLTLTWCALPNLPMAVCRHTMAVLNDRVFIHGGYDGNSIANQFISVSLLAEEEIAPEEPLPAPTSWSRSNALTLKDLELDPDLAEEFNEIDEMEFDEQDSERYRLLHRIACERGYLQYVDPASGYTVFTELFLKKRACCGYKCRHCPWGHRNVPKEKSKMDW